MSFFFFAQQAKTVVDVACDFAVRLRAVSYFSLQSYYTRNSSTRAAKPRSVINEDVSPKRKKISVRVFSCGPNPLL